MAGLTQEGRSALNALAINLQVPPGWLYSLIKHETAGTFDPSIKNPYSSARGMIQFIDSTAKSLGYENSEDLIRKNPTQESQLLGPVYQYLRKFLPFQDDKSLYLAVFYPKARAWPMSQEFPEHVQRANPGIKTVGDYVRKVRSAGGIAAPAVTAAFLAAVGFIVWRANKKGGV